jgi:hypothetical protein
MARSYCIGLGVHKETIVIAYAADCKIAPGTGAPSSGLWNLVVWAMEPRRPGTGTPSSGLWNPVVRAREPRRPGWGAPSSGLWNPVVRAREPQQPGSDPIE